MYCEPTTMTSQFSLKKKLVVPIHRFPQITESIRAIKSALLTCSCKLKVNPYFFSCKQP